MEISTPIMLNRQLWETSGHWDHYKENMYTTVIDDQDYRDQTDELPGRRSGLCSPSRVPTVICRFVWESWDWFTVMRNPVSSTV